MTRRERIRQRARRLFREHRGGIHTFRGGEQRYPGMTMQTALAEARTLERFEHLESVGLVRFRWVPDDQWTMEDLEGDCFRPECHPEISAERIEREREEFHRTVERDGVWGIVGEYRLLPLHHGEGDIVTYCDPDDEQGWEHGGSVWGFVGTEGNGYETDIMAETMDALLTALRARPPRCSACGRR